MLGWEREEVERGRVGGVEGARVGEVEGMRLDCTVV